MGRDGVMGGEAVNRGIGLVVRRVFFISPTPTIPPLPINTLVTTTTPLHRFNCDYKVGLNMPLMLRPLKKELLIFIWRFKYFFPLNLKA